MNDAIAHAAFVSFNFGEGRGGHYLSMAETIRSGIFEAPLVLDLGFQPTPPLDGLRSIFVPHGWTGHARARKLVRESVAAAGTRIVFCYDIHSYNIAADALAGAPVKLVYVKCGGPTLTLYYPRPQSLIVFSDEDDAFFADRLPGAVRAKIPNRVSEQALVAKQAPLSAEAQSWIDAHGDAERIVCIARISHSYARKIARAVDYLEATQQAARPATLTIIGYVEHEEVFEHLLERRQDGLQILTDPYHTTDSGRFLSNFQTAITTGRGTVEAVLCGLRVLVPYDASTQLAALSPETYAGLLRTNFSGRARPDDVGQRVIAGCSASQAEEVRARIRADFAIEHAGPKFLDLVKRLPAPKPASWRTRLLGRAYFQYAALQIRSRLVRSTLQSVRRRPPALDGGDK